MHRSINIESQVIAFVRFNSRWNANAANLISSHLISLHFISFRLVLGDSS